MDIVATVTISIILMIICFIVGQKTVKHQEQLNNDIVLQQRALIEKDIESQKNRILELTKEYERQKQLVSDAKISAEEAYNEKYKALDIEYIQKQKEIQNKYEQYEKELQNRVDERILEKEIEIEEVKAELSKLKSTRDAVIEAARQERIIQEQPEKYCIPMEDTEVHDIEYLNGIMPKLNHPEVLGKCIWSVFYQKKIKTFLMNILGPQDVCGIYKITDRLTQEMYIGQSKCIQKRWVEHIKCGVGATPSSNANQLYAAMKRDGVWNFSFELLEQCGSDVLNDKERYFIDIYSSDSIGLNTKRGNQ